MIRQGADRQFDARGLMFEAFRMPELTDKDCRSILLDWALGLPDDAEYKSALQRMLDLYGESNADHPMTALLREGLELASGTQRTRGRYSARRRGSGQDPTT